MVILKYWWVWSCICNPFLWLSDGNVSPIKVAGLKSSQWVTVPSGKGRHTGCQVFCMILVQHIYSGRVFPWCRMAFIAWNSWNSVVKITFPMPGVGVIENQLCLWVFESPSSEPEWSPGSSTSHSPGEWESCSKHFVDFLTFVCMEHNYSTH